MAIRLGVLFAGAIRDSRVVRLRPELLALLIILLAIPFAARQRWMALGVLMLLAYWYTAFHVSVFLCVVWIAVCHPADGEGGMPAGPDCSRCSD